MRGCGPNCTKRVEAVALCRGGSGRVRVCLTCGEALTLDHGLSDEDIAVIVAMARTLNARSKTENRSTLRTGSRVYGKSLGIDKDEKD